jgi:ribonuclease D
VLPDSAIVEAALADPSTVDELVALPVFSGRAQRRLASAWLDALRRAKALPRSELPDPNPPSNGPPPVNRWTDRDPAAAARLAAARSSITAIAERHRLPVENLLQPELVMRATPPPAPPPAPPPDAG